MLLSKKTMKSFFLIFLVLVSSISIAQNKKGFDLSNSTITLNKIKDGGPPKDGIPAIDEPKFKKASEVSLEANSRVLGVNYNGIAKAYPIAIMNYHEIVNDFFDGHPVVITYCPLCGSGVAFHARIDGSRNTFGVSGLLYNSDVLLYDRETESLWSQIMMEAISGDMVGKELEMVPTMNTTWRQWKNKYPNTLVLSEDTGYRRNYDRNPYPGYSESTEIYFEVEKSDQRFHPKETIIGIELNGKFKAYPFSELKKVKNGFLKDEFQEMDLLINYDKKSRSATIKNKDGEELATLTTFWFAWFAFHPDTEVFYAK